MPNNALDPKAAATVEATRIDALRIIAGQQINGQPSIAARIAKAALDKTGTP